MRRVLSGLVLLIVAQAPVAFLLREPANTPLPGDESVHEAYDYLPFQNPDTRNKFTDAEAVQQVLFVLACKSKHKNDVDGMTRDAATSGKFTEKQFQNHMQSLQDANVKQMDEACSVLNAKYLKECQEGCTAKWAKAGAFTLVDKKKACLEKCGTKHTNWGNECKEQVENLKNVYAQEQGNLAQTKKCQQVHCKLFPAVLAAKDDEAEEIKEKGCKAECSEKGIKAKCVKKWDMNVDFAMAKIQSECEGTTKSEKLEPCMKDGTAEIDGDHTKCKDEGQGKCDDKHTNCMDEGKSAGEDSMVGAHAESICGTRKENCYTQTDTKCMKKQKKSLDKLAKKCKKQFKEENDKCQDEKVKEKKDEFLGKCQDEDKPKCSDECLESCQIPNLRECQKDMLEKSFGVTQQYCSQMWDWLFNSEQVDAATGDVIPKAEGGGRHKLIAPKRLG